MIIFLSLFFIIYCLSVSIFIYVIKSLNADIDNLYNNYYEIIGKNFVNRNRGVVENDERISDNG